MAPINLGLREKDILSLGIMPYRISIKNIFILDLFISAIFSCLFLQALMFFSNCIGATQCDGSA
jgi:hypothetical protein